MKRKVLTSRICRLRWALVVGACVSLLLLPSRRAQAGNYPAWWHVRNVVRTNLPPSHSVLKAAVPRGPGHAFGECAVAIMTPLAEAVQYPSWLVERSAMPAATPQADANRTWRGALPDLLELAAPGIMRVLDSPPWWVPRGVILSGEEEGGVTNDYAAVNAGQLKWIATMACDELESLLPGGAGSNVWMLVGGFADTNNYYGVNAGQLKCVAQPFYDRLIAVDYTDSYPWTPTTADDLDYAAVNIGQVKYLFSFDVRDSDSDGLYDGNENGSGLYEGPYNTGSDPNDVDTDDDGIGDKAEAKSRTDPNNGDISSPTVWIMTPTMDVRIVVLP